MQIGVSSYSYSRLVKTGALKQLDVIQKAKEMGFDVIEFSTIAVPEGKTLPAFAAELKAESQRVGIPIVNYTIGADFISGSGGDLKAEIERVKREEADRLQREAVAKQQANAPTQQVRETMQAATVAHVHADSAAVAAAAPAADLTRTKTAAGTASLSDGTIVGTISDWNKIDWNMIGPHVARADAEKAIRAYIRANKEVVKQMIKDGKTIAGVIFTIDQKGNYR